MKDIYAFRALLQQDDGTTGTYVTVPVDLMAAFGGRSRVPVRGTINAVPFRGSIVPMGSGRFLLGINRALRSQAQAQAGDEVDIVLERDVEPRTVAVPPDLMAAFSQHPAAEVAWGKLSYTRRKEIAEAIESAKRADTRGRRVERALDELLGR